MHAKECDDNTRILSKTELRKYNPNTKRGTINHIAYMQADYKHQFEKDKLRL